MTKQTIKDIDIKKIKEKKKREQNLKNNLKRKQIEAIRVINYIVRKGCSDEYSLKHTHMKRSELLEELEIPEGEVPRGFEIDHIRPRCKHITEGDFQNINAYWNLQLISRKKNIELGQKIV